MIPVTETLAIPEEELVFTTSRSGGPGGQHVNKVETRVTLLFDVLRSPSLTDRQRARILSRLRGRISSAGLLHVSASSTRSQARNRQDAIERFRELLAEALAETPPRRPTAPSRGARERRLAEKKRRAALKRLRGERPAEE